MLSNPIKHHRASLEMLSSSQIKPSNSNKILPSSSRMLTCSNRIFPTSQGMLLIAKLSKVIFELHRLSPSSDLLKDVVEFRKNIAEHVSVMFHRRLDIVGT